MFRVAFISHGEVSDKQLAEIIELKSKAWDYSFDRQLKWINSNLKKTDIHVILSLNKNKIAYLNLIEIKIKIDGKLMDGYGIGNVCTRERGNGWGQKIMTYTNQYLSQKNRIGLLFCKKLLVNFYSLNNWEQINKSKLELSFNDELIETMKFNCNIDFFKLEYLSKPF